ncbi:Lysophospholipase L1 [Verrucomicrobium sp. GAS474]|uniref:SGNH/GDSL hydrolase family protein n=1 Tax=Verrucomicrobium sp. GAS474 TaxID=1882831 RepID=UPI00087A1DB2|nr:SGNH/GDSL hydrolase family protein [Verrucomicrobium sp. GAS474]SDU07465.1 Lysophospholipase L1 [Verrucomicrobium sp. GAS474]
MHHPLLRLLLFFLLLIPGARLPAKTAVLDPTVQGAIQSDVDLGGHTLKNAVIDGSGTVTLNLPKASSGTLGAVKIGSGIAVAGDGTLSPSSGTGLQKGNGSGGFTPAAAGTDYVAPSPSLTTQGNTFNGASQLLQADVRGRLAKSALGSGIGATFLFEGDSITYGQYLATPATQCYSALFAAQPFATGSAAIRNDAVSGSDIAGASSRYAANVYPHRPAASGGDGGPAAYLVLMIGINDIASGSSASALLSALSAYTAQARTDGFTVVLATLLPAARNNTVPLRAVYEACNAAIRTRQVPCDYVWDAALALPNPNDTALFPDNLHPSAAGHLALASSLNSQLLAGGHLVGIQPTSLPGNVMNFSPVNTKALSFWYTTLDTGVQKDALDFMFNFTNAQPTAGTPWIFTNQSDLCLNSADNTHAIRLQDVTGGPIALGGALSGGAASFSGVVSASSFSGSFLGSGSGLTNLPLSSLASGSAASGQVLTWNGAAWSPGTPSTGYLPLAGGTLTGSLSGTSAAFSGTLSAAPYVSVSGLITNYVSGSAMYGSNGGGVLIESGAPTSTAYINYYSHAPVDIGHNGGAVSIGSGGLTVAGQLDGPNGGFTTGGGLLATGAQFGVQSSPLYGSATGGFLIESNTSNNPGFIAHYGSADVHIADGGGAVTIGGGGLSIAPGATLTVKSGTNALAGTVTLSSGTATITSTAITANTVIVLSRKTAGGTAGSYAPRVDVSAGSAVVTGLSTDTGTYNWIGLKVN